MKTKFLNVTSNYDGVVIKKRLPGLTLGEVLMELIDVEGLTRDCVVRSFNLTLRRADDVKIHVSG